jgi:hypothetical protein
MKRRKLTSLFFRFPIKKFLWTIYREALGDTFKEQMVMNGRK